MSEFNSLHPDEKADYMYERIIKARMKNKSGYSIKDACADSDVSRATFLRYKLIRDEDLHQYLLDKYNLSADKIMQSNKKRWRKIEGDKDAEKCSETKYDIILRQKWVSECRI